MKIIIICQKNKIISSIMLLNVLQCFNMPTKNPELWLGLLGNFPGLDHTRCPRLLPAMKSTMRTDKYRSYLQSIFDLLSSPQSNTVFCCFTQIAAIHISRILDLLHFVKILVKASVSDVCLEQLVGTSNLFLYSSYRARLIRMRCVHDFLVVSEDHRSCYLLVLIFISFDFIVFFHNGSIFVQDLT